LYVTFVSILGLYFVFISFYRNKKQLFNFSFVFIGILTLHFIVILYKLQGDKINQLFTLQHYSVTVFGILLTTIISSLMISVLEELQQQTVAQKEIIERQNTELKKTLEKQARFLMLGNENLKEFAAITSHDLKEPLRNISGFVSLIKRKIEPEAISQNQELQEYFEFVQSGVKKMEVLIHDIGDYSSINILEKNFADVDMNALIKNVIHTFDQQIAGKNITIDVQRLPAVWGDKTLLFALFQKLISNAIRFRNNEMPCYILIGTESGDNQVSFFIKDNGVGISEEYLQKIFAPFRKLKGDTESKTSSGLGLATCKKIIEIHNGEIWAESKAGSGSVFYFKIGKN
jgi:light-regulated signal transduction histidine kinase (bacteriophytochrome)